MEFLLPKSLFVENENLNCLNTVLSVEFLVFISCLLDEQGTDFIPICRTGKKKLLWGFQNKNHTGIFHGARQVYSVSTLILHTWCCAEVLKGRRFAWKNQYNGKLSMVKSKVCMWRTRTKPLLCVRKKAGTLLCTIQEDGQRNFPLWCNLVEKKIRFFHASSLILLVLIYMEDLFIAV